MKAFFRNITAWIRAHRKTSITIGAAAALVVYLIVKASGSGAGPTTYVLAAVTRGTVIASVSGTGQVSATNQVDVSSKASGEITYLNAVAGQEVKKGTLLAQIDPGNAAFELETARLSYEKLTTTDPDDLRDAQDAQADAYASARSTMTSTLADMNDATSGIEEILNGYLGDANQSGLGSMSRGYIDTAQDDYYAAKKLFDALAKKYRGISSTASEMETDAMLSTFSDTATAVAQATKSAQDAVVYVRAHEDNDSSAADEAYASVTALASTAHGAAADIASAKSATINATRTLSDLQNGPDALDLRSEALSLRQKQEAYEDYSIRAPFDGLIASVDAVKGQTASSSTKIATVITKQKIAEISLNEVDAAKVAVGQKATLTFDALDDLSISGEVAEVNLVGAVSQGVVNYTVKISFDTDDDRVRPGMTVSADIVTDIRQDVLTVPASAVKVQGGTSYVQVVEGSGTENAAASAGGIPLAITPTQVAVETGLASDDSVEIVSGLSEGERIVARTVTASTTAKAPTQSSAPSLIGGGGGTFRAGGTGGGFQR